MAPSRTSAGGGGVSDPIASSTGVTGASESKLLNLPDFEECVEANLIVAVYQGPNFAGSMTNFETFIGGLGFPSDFISSPFSLNMYSDLTTDAEVQSSEPDSFGNGSQNTAGPLPFSRDLYPHDSVQAHKSSTSRGSKSFYRSINHHL